MSKINKKLADTALGIAALIFILAITLVSVIRDGGK